ncbi:hypothetical protein Acor_84040 [Acrocarpospora corrugata]|uniref:Translation elongation factor EFTu/EF1A C-terminal domain-containing protein n=1 Tax=Acrocarpospora corrugata TaxID=35763 RepID=A0A5M3WBB8_9ACTN|nr:hypothetical protein [Acrocarpospora corrugata]GES06335.1 hypothetical protein Acor_84040 [Acrocarpospora corrugata]
MTRMKVRALITLLPPEQGGLSHALPHRTQSLTVRAHHREAGVVRRRPFAAAIITDDWMPLTPGDKHHIVTMIVTDDKAAEYLRPGERFDLWCGHDIGGGIVSRRIVI